MTKDAGSDRPQGARAASGGKLVPIMQADPPPEVRQAITAIRSEADALLNELRGEIAKQRQAAEHSWHQAAASGGKTLLDIIRQLTESRRSAEEAGESARKLLAQVSNQFLQIKTEIEQLYARRRAELKTSIENAIATRADLDDFAESVQERLERDLAAAGEQFSARTENLAAECLRGINESSAKALAEITESNRALQIASTHLNADRTALSDELTALRKEAQDCRTEYAHSAAAMRRERTAIIGDLQSAIAKAGTQADELEERLVGSIQRNAARLEEQRSIADGAVAHAEQSAQSLREQARRTAHEVRTSLSQMQQSAEQLKADLRNVAENIRHNTSEAGKRLDELASTIESQSTAALESAKAVLDEVRTSGATLLGDAKSIFEKSSAESDLHEKRMAASAAERIEALRLEGDTLLGQMRQLHGAFTGSMDEFRPYLSEARREVLALSETARQFQDQVLEVHAEVKSQTQRLLAEAREVQGRAQQLLGEHQSLSADAQHRAAAIRDMSTTLSNVLTQLQTAGQSAERHNERLQAENETAEQKLGQMRQHSQRLSQLIEVIREVYSTIDARVEGLRYGLAAAEQFSKNGIGTGRSSVEDQVPVPAKPPSRAAKPAPARSEPVSRDPAKGSLGEIVSRNQKLNAWLHEILHEEPSGSKRAAPPTRADQQLLTRTP